MPTPLLGHVLPSEIAEAAAGDLDAFHFTYGSALLLVRLKDGDNGLVDALLASSKGARSKPARGALEFKTAAAQARATGEGSQRPGGRSSRQIAMRLARRLSDGVHYAVPLRKRTKGAFMDRISVGRAANMDVVLRDASVSKFHAWFEVDDAGAVYVADAGSTNSTFVNGAALATKKRTRVALGDRLGFGSVEAVLSSARELCAAFAK